MPSLPRIARSPHTAKPPGTCPHYGSHVLSRRGIGKEKLEIVQLLALLVLQARVHASSRSSAYAVVRPRWRELGGRWNSGGEA
jgi:hypothetical protein